MTRLSDSTRAAAVTAALATACATAVIGAALATVQTAPAAAETLAGTDRLTVRAGHRPAPVAGSVWYPAGTPTYRGMVGDNAVFVGTPGHVGAALADGPHPLVLLSHGSGGNMDNIAWLSSGLAQRGAMVLAVNHPGSTSGDSSPRRSVLLDERAQDLSAALDALLADPVFGPQVDRARIVTLGFSLGGATALGLAGARFDGAAYAGYCGRHADTAADCVFLGKGGVDLTRMPAGFEAEARDPRVTAAIAVDPGFTYALTEESAAAMDLPVLLVSLGREHLWMEADVSETGSNLVNRLPEATHVTVAPAHHFTFLGVCTPDGAAILKDEKDDPVCDDPAGTDRAEAHSKIVEAVATFLRRGNQTD